MTRTDDRRSDRTSDRLSARLSELLGLTLRSWRAAPALWLGLLALAVAVCALAAWVGMRIGGHPSYLYGEFREHGFYGGLMTAASAFFLGAAAMALLAVAAILRREPCTRRQAPAWILAAAGLVLLGADDLLLIHEIASYRLDRLGVPRPFGIPFDRLAILLYGVGALLLLGTLLDTLRAHWKPLFPLAAALALLAASELLDAVLVGDATKGVGMWLAPLDRIVKTIGSFMALVFAQTLVISLATEAAGGRGADQGRDGKT
ncbi:MAG TPA: hypothetical protein VFQ22_02830 [Longimicrobiales bacterium]|nr:hypothetical protein [Longimicrobiales bacterium]